MLESTRLEIPALKGRAKTYLGRQIQHITLHTTLLVYEIASNLENAFDVRPSILVTARHEGGAITCTFFSPGHTRTHILQAFLSKLMASVTKRVNKCKDKYQLSTNLVATSNVLMGLNYRSIFYAGMPLSIICPSEVI